MSFYAVSAGRSVGIYNTWDECKAQVHKFTNAKFKKFKTRNEAENFIKDRSIDENTKPSSISEQQKKITFVDFWPDDVGGDEDDMWLATEASKLEKTISSNSSASTAVTTRSVKKYEPFAPRSLKEMLKTLRRKSIVYRPATFRVFGDYTFPVDSEDYVLVYTDGACDKNGWHNAKAGIGVWYNDGHPLNVSKPVTGRATNNTAEIQAACEAIRLAKGCGVKKLRINTDSQFLINSVTVWMRSWKRNNWQLSNGAPVKNMKDFRIVDELLGDRSIKVEWNYVKGHACIKGNMRADHLAKMGTLSYKRQYFPR